MIFVIAIPLFNNAYNAIFQMKTIVNLFITVFVLTASARSEDGQVVPPSGSTVAPVAVPTAARILGSIPDGTPPPPAPLKPAFVVPAENIIESSTREQGGRTITIQKIKPIALPAPPDPAPASALPDNAAFKARLAEYRASHPETLMLSLGATVYRFKDSPPRTLVRYWPAQDAEPITFWSSADFSLISGIHSFVGTDGLTYSLFMAWGNIDTTRTAAIPAGMYHPPEIPAFPDGPSTFTIVGTPPAAEILAPIQSLHDLYNSEFNRLNTAAEGRERARLQREADLKANPPRPKDIVINYWRTERPAPVKGEGK